jgi:hypothetical protein
MGVKLVGHLHNREKAIRIAGDKMFNAAINKPGFSKRAGSL